MSALGSALEALLERLTDRGTRVAIVGGLAVSARTEPRFTRDADVCVAVDDDEQAESLVRTAGRWLPCPGPGRAGGHRPRRDGSSCLTRADGRGSRARPPVASSGIESEVIAGADEMELFEGVRAAIASTASLIALKVLSRDDLTRPQDRVDLVALLAIASSEDIGEATRLLGLIQDRGYGRGRDLVALLDELQAELA